MSKIAITADPHFHTFPEFSRVVRCPVTDFVINSRLSDQIVTFWNMAKRANKLECGYLVVIGDLFHVRGVVPAEVTQAVYRLFERIRKELKMVIYISTGNHDQVDVLGTIHGIYSFKNLVQMIDTPLREEIGGTTCVFIPYMASHEDTLHCFARADIDGPVDIVFAHCGVDGAYIGPVEYKIKDPLTVEDINAERFKWVILGHYHKPQNMSDNVLYVGSPAQINRGEAGEKKRWLIYDSSTGGLKSYASGAKEFRRITSSEWVASDSLPSHYYDIEEDGFTPLAEVREHTSQHEVGYKLIPLAKTKGKEARVKFTEGMSDRDLLSKYIDYVNGDSKALKLGLKLLSEAVSSQTLNLKLKRLVIKNFMTISEADINLDNPGSVIALLGQNDSTEGFTSNGAGKSTLLPESILWCLYGDTARGLPADKVVNRVAKRDCEVTLIFQDSQGWEITATRYRKHKVFGANGLILLVNGKDITQGTILLNQARLDQIVGVDWEMFNAVIAFSPDSLRFIQATETNRKHVMDAILQTQRYAAAKQLADNGVKNLETTLSARYTAINKLKDGYTRDSELLGGYREQEKLFNGREAERVADLKRELGTYIEQLAEQQDMLARAETKSEDAKLKLDVTLPDLTATQAELVQASEALATANAEVRHLKLECERNQGKLDAAVNQAGKPCPTCGQPVANTGTLINNYRREVKRINQLVELSETTGLHLEAEKTRCQKAHSDANAIHVRYNTNKSWAADAARTVNSIKSTINVVNQDIARCKLSISRAPNNPFPVMIDKLIGEMASHLEEQGQLEVEQVKQQALQEKLRFWQRGFGSVGIPLFLLEQMMPTLTEYANDISYKLTGGSIRIEFSTYSESTMVDRFKIQAFNEDGSDVYAGNSSGEKRRIDLCVMLALFQVAYERTKVNVLLLDEALDTLDTAGLDSVVEVLNNFAKELNLTIYVTSHTDLNQRLFESIVVHKENGVSTCFAQ